MDNTSGTQEGRWRITKLELWNVFDETGKEYTQEDPLIFEEGEEGIGTITTKVVVKPVVSFGATDQGKTFGKTGETVNGAFMQSYTLSGLWVDIKDFEGKAMEVSDVQLSYVYGNNSSTYGGYTSTSLTNAVTDFTINLEDDGSGMHFAQTGSRTVQYAGSYALTFSFKIGETTQTYSGDNLPANAPKFTISSVKPTVKITYAEYKNKNGSQSTFTDTATTVYYKESTSSSCGITYYQYTPAKVNITLSGYGNAAGARLEFTTSNTDGKVHLYEESQKDDGTSTNAYSWTGDGSCTRYMGFWESKTGNDEKIPAGTLTATTLIFTYGGNEYSIDVPDFTIKNPS